ncbi:MAG TPA: SGNH/GDSL hydrolase family protein [Myxococcota bacterium]|nr:SGNH/GDSL hydrolase family protein [Myxococcota bacterium]
MRRPGRAEILLLFVSGLVTLAGLEAAIRAGFVPLPEYVDSDGWQRERWHRRESEVATSKRIDRFDPDLGWTLLENVRDVTVNGAPVSSNSAGMRGVREYRADGNPEGMRVAALGDSFTFGQCVRDEEAFPARLEQRIWPGEVMNFGVHGYGHDQQLLRLRRDAFAFHPDVVLIGFYNSDVGRNRLTFRDYAKPWFRLRGGDLVLEGVPVPSPEEFAAQLHLRSANYARMLFDTVFEGRLERRNRKVTEAILRTVAAESRATGARFALVYLPSRNQVKAGRAWPSRVYKHLCEDPEVLCIDPTPRMHAALAGDPDPDSHFECHYSPFLHQVVAEVLAESLETARAAQGGAEPR